jgi:ornithine carbamoyltransferase
VSLIQRFLEVDDLDRAHFNGVLEHALVWKNDPRSLPRVLEGHAAAVLFEKPSARTRVSTEVAIWSLGGHAVVLRGKEEVGLGVRESVEDLARTLASYCSVIAARVYDHAALETMAATVDVPVVNLLSDRAHPCQALADYLTIREHFGDLEGRRLTFVGDGNNVAASLAFGAALTGVEFTVASPPGYELDDDVVQRARNLGAQLELTHDPHEAVRGVDVVYTDVWTSMGQEAESDQRRIAFDGYQVDPELMATAGPDAVFMHCLPAHRGEEVSADVIDGPASLVWLQAQNRMHSVRSLLASLAVREAGVGGNAREGRA